MQKKRLFISNLKMQKRMLLQRSARNFHDNIKFFIIKPRVKFTDGSVVDLQSLILRFNPSLTLT